MASQPPQDTAYTTPGNPTSKNPAEASQTSFNATDNSASVDQRIPTKQSTDAQGLRNAKFGEGAGIHGAPPGEEAKGLTEEDVGRHNELDGAQMAASGEGEVAAVVGKKGKGTGGGGAEPDLASDLDRKKAEQAEARNEIKQAKGEGMQSGGAFGQQGGPADSSGR